MDIFIDGERDTELPEPELSETVDEYLGRINEEFADTNRVVQIEAVNRQNLTEEMLEREARNLERLDLSVKTIENVAVDSIVYLAEYLDRALQRFPDIIDDWEQEDTDQRETYEDQLEEAFEAIDQIITSLPEMVDLEQQEDALLDIHDQLRDLRRELEDSAREQYQPILENVRELFSDLRQELENIIHVLSQQLESLEQGRKKYSNLIEQYLEDIPSLVETLQSTKTSETYDRVGEILEGLNGVLDYMNSLDRAGKIKLLFSPEDQETLNKAHEELDTGLDELERAFEDRDLVMICDILEYEIQPYLEKIQQFLEGVEITPGRLS